MLSGDDEDLRDDSQAPCTAFKGTEEAVAQLHSHQQRSTKSSAETGLARETTSCPVWQAAVALSASDKAKQACWEDRGLAVAGDNAAQL